MAWPGQFRLIQVNTGALTQCLFTAVIVGVTEVALDTARKQLAPVAAICERMSGWNGQRPNWRVG
jgi:hypothetical protein